MKSVRVLVAPLDWGLGHATRCIPVIHQLLLEHCEVIIAGNGYSLDLLKMEFPSLQTYILPGYNPRYSATGGMAWKMAAQLYKFLQVIKKEYEAVQEIVRRNKVQFIISDNRYGCWSPLTRNIFITHQLTILMPPGFGWLAKIVNHANHKAIKKFHHCWVPDWPGDDKLSGKLSTKNGLSVKYTGMLSRFAPSAAVKKEYDILILLSGPEPQRSILEKIISGQLKQVKDLNVVVVRGLPEQNGTDFFSSEVEVIGFPSAERLQYIIERSAIVIARSGYSTIMDLARLHKRAIFIPTPGQTEQEYLAKHMEEKGIAYFAEQHTFTISSALEMSDRYAGFGHYDNGHDLLKGIIAELVNAAA